MDGEEPLLIAQWQPVDRRGGAGALEVPDWPSMARTGRRRAAKRAWAKEAHVTFKGPRHALANDPKKGSFAKKICFFAKAEGKLFCAQFAHRGSSLAFFCTKRESSMTYDVLITAVPNGLPDVEHEADTIRSAFARRQIR